MSDIIIQGNLLKYKPKMDVFKKHICGIRGLVYNLTNASRRRLMESLAIVDYELMESKGYIFLFAHLTTPKEFWKNPKFVKKSFDSLRKKIIYHYPDFIGAHWKRELGEKNGMLHYHLLLYFSSNVDISNFNDFLKNQWKESLRYSGEFVITSAEVVTDFNNASRYITKYIAKVAYGGDQKNVACEDFLVAAGAPVCADLSNAQTERVHWGRWWGVWCRENIYWSDRSSYREIGDCLTVKIENVANKVRRVGVKLLKSRVYKQIKQISFRKLNDGFSERCLQSIISRPFSKEHKNLLKFLNKKNYYKKLSQFKAGFTLILERSEIDNILFYCQNSS